MTIDRAAIATRPCPVCDTVARFAYEHPEANIYRCESCEHCFSDVGSMPEQMTYSEDYFTAAHKNWFDQPNFKLFGKIAKIIDSQFASANVLDVGCGQGDFLRFLQRHSNTSKGLVGLDVCEMEPVSGIRFIKGDICDRHIDETFDVIVNLAVIEHLPDVRSMVKVMEQSLRSGGIIITMTVNASGLLYTSSRLMSKLGVRAPFDRLYSKHHVQHFNVSSLRRLFERYELELVEHWDHNVPLKSVDFEANSRIQKLIFQLGVAGCFSLGHLLRGCYLQTLVCRKS